MVAAAFGLVVAVAGGSGVTGTGATGALALSMVAAGGSLVLASGAFAALVRRGDRPATLSPDGIRVPTFLGVREIAWADVERCEIREADGGRRGLLAAWSSSEPDGQPVWLGDARNASIPEPDLMATARRWMAG
ncbi:hypothetical protein GCM10010191_54150 [Actinomadura vinacea]|uniref:PH domain-containing protein n=2 Tax=Actinomadura vinacea TaxID=115336 RepID=A0ABP5WQC1_9ACTN